MSESVMSELGYDDSIGVPATSGLQGVLWDMDGTLLDSEKLWDVAVRELSLYLGGPMSEQTRRQTIGASSASALATIVDSLGLARDPAAVADAKDWLYARVGELFSAGIPWRPGAREALRTVRESGLGTALVTNTERLTERALDTLGRAHFDVCVCGDEVPVPAAPRRVFRTSLEDLVVVDLHAAFAPAG